MLKRKQTHANSAMSLLKGRKKSFL